MTHRCPECNGRLFLRAVRVVELRPRARLWAWLMGDVAERLAGYNVICADRDCGCVVRVDGEGVRRLVPHKPTVAEGPPLPPAPEKRPAMELNRTPGMQWTRPDR